MYRYPVSWQFSSICVTISVTGVLNFSYKWTRNFTLSHCSQWTWNTVPHFFFKSFSFLSLYFYCKLSKLNAYLWKNVTLEWIKALFRPSEILFGWMKRHFFHLKWNGMYEKSPKVIIFSGNRECPTVRIVISITVQAPFFIV